MILFVWAAIFAIVALIGYYSTRMAKRETDDQLQDTGLAILEFGRAFPSEAIRTLYVTADGQAVFVRLHDNKAGFMRHMRSHYACHLIEPGTVRVRPLGNGYGFAVQFLDAPFHDGEFFFAHPEEAAEVSLWLLGNYVTAADVEDIAAPATPAR